MDITKLRTLHISFLMSLILISACGNFLDSDQTIDAEDTQNKSAVIVGTLDWQSVTNFEDRDPVRIRANAVGNFEIHSYTDYHFPEGTSDEQGRTDIKLKATDRCTGFLISEDILMTNNHCVGSRAIAETISKVAFRFEDGVIQRNSDSYDCSEFIGTSKLYDYTLLRCSGHPGRQNGYLELQARPDADSNFGLYIIHQNCIPDASTTVCEATKKYSPGKIIDYTYTSSSYDDPNETVDLSADANDAALWVKLYKHTGDIFGGSSGAPMFAQDNQKVFAINNSEQAEETEENRGLAPELTINGGVSMESIIPDIRSRFSYLNIPSLSGGAASLVVRSSQPRYEEPAAEYEEEYEYEYEDVPTSDSVDESLSADIHEPNNDLAGATTVESYIFESGLSIHEAGDKDLYKLVVDYKSDVLVEMNFLHANGDLEVALYNTDGVTVLASSTTSEDLEKIHSMSLEPGSYYVMVYGYENATNNYDLFISINPSFN